MWVAIILVGSVIFLIHKLINTKNNFWEEYSVRQIHNSTFIDKILLAIGKVPLSDFDEVAYKEMGRSGEKFVGIIEMQQPILLVKDLEIIKKVLIKDFDHFTDRRPFANSSTQEIVNKLLGNLTGEEWKGVRAQLSPTFTTGKIKRMMELFNSVSNDWVDYLKENATENGGESLLIKVHKETTHFTTDVIAATVFGMKAGVRHADSYFAKMVHKLSDFGLLDIIKFTISSSFPKLWNKLKLPIINQEALDFFTSLFSKGMKARKEGDVKVNDFIQLLVEARKGDIKSIGPDELDDFEKDAQLNVSGKKNYLNDDLMVMAQALQFFFAGFSTVSNYIAFIMYTLAVNPDIQDKLRNEVNSQLFSGGDRDKNIDYDKLNKLVYLDMVLCEVLRKFPPLSRLERVCSKDYHDAEENLKVPKGAIVGIPVHSIHNDTAYYEHPDKFYPEHFSPEKKAARNPYCSLFFGCGPRNFSILDLARKLIAIAFQDVYYLVALQAVPIRVCT